MIAVYRFERRKLRISHKLILSMIDGISNAFTDTTLIFKRFMSKYTSTKGYLYVRIKCKLKWSLGEKVVWLKTNPNMGSLTRTKETPIDVCFKTQKCQSKLKKWHVYLRKIFACNIDGSIPPEWNRCLTISPLCTWHCQIFRFLVSLVQHSSYFTQNTWVTDRKLYSQFFLLQEN